MRARTTVLAILLGCTLLTSCMELPAVFTRYVVLRPEQQASFPVIVLAIADADGLDAAYGEARSDTGDVMRNLEIRGHGARVVILSMPLSKDADPAKCRTSPGQTLDDLQYVLFATRRVIGTRDAAITLGERISAQIAAKGYDVRTRPSPCGGAPAAPVT